MVISSKDLVGPFTAAQSDKLKAVLNPAQEQYVCASKGFPFHCSNYTTFTAATCRTRHVATQDCTNIVLTYGSYTASASVPESPFANQFEIKCSIEVDGVIHPVFFKTGKRLQIMYPGVTVETMPEGVRLSKGQVFWVRTFCNRIISNTFSIANGETGQITSNQTNWPRNSNIRGLAAGTGEGVTFTGSTGVDPFLTDATDSGTISASDNEVYGPSMITGELQGQQYKSVCVLGDSISDAADDGVYQGYAVRAFGDAIGYVRCSIGGQQANQLLTNQWFQFKRYLASKCANCILWLGTNDIAAADRTADQIIADLQTVMSRLPKNIKQIYLATMLPRSTSSGNWETVANQTATTANNFTAKRAAVNAWIRSSGYQYFEFADLMENSRDSGVWKPSAGVYTSSTSTGFTATVMTDSAQNFPVNGLIGKVLIVAGQSRVINSNTATTVTVGTLSPTPGATTAYTIQDTFTADGVHPSGYGHSILATAINNNLWV